MTTREPEGTSVIRNCKVCDELDCARPHEPLSPLPIGSGYGLPDVYAGWVPDNRRAFVIVVPEELAYKITVEPRQEESILHVPAGGAVITSNGGTVLGPGAFPFCKAVMPGNMHSDTGYSFGPLAAVLPQLNADKVSNTPSDDAPVASSKVVCGVIDCASPVGSDAVTVNMPNGTTVSICRYCAEERITWPRWKPYQNNTPIERPCPHCRVRIGPCGAVCPCIKRLGDPNYEHPPQLFAGERDLITRLDDFITKRFPNQIRSDEHPCDSAIRILGDLAKRM